jgi:succinyl-diaminopimelate desuccinylase
LKDILAAIEKIMQEVAARRKVAMSHETAQRMESKPTAADAPLVKLLSAAVKAVYGVDTRPIGIGGGTVGAILRNVDIDAAVWSRLHESAHQPNEFTLIENIVGDAKVMARLMMEKR